MKIIIFAWLFALFPISHVGLQSVRIHSRCQGLYFQMAMVNININNDSHLARINASINLVPPVTTFRLASFDQKWVIMQMRLSKTDFLRVPARAISPGEV